MPTRQQAFTVGMPLHNDVTQLSVADLDPVRTSAGLGFDSQYQPRAEAVGLTPEQAQEAREAALAQPTADEVNTPDVKPHKAPTVSHKMKPELEKVNVDPPDLKAKIVDVKQAVALLKEQKQLSAVQQAARIDHATEP